ncbi:MAG: hypothetical protein M5R41_08790 [Bacteroidia bacterium]|nr:hypothetical protein [Bacteroidia bacterium]
MLSTELSDPPTTEGGAGGAPPPLAHGYSDGKGLATVAVVIILAVAVAGLAVYGLYYGVRWAVRR